jgi:hypothetical protein
MPLDLDTFLTTVYCVIDDLYREQFAAARPVRPGVEPELSDSEVLTLAVLAQWQARNSESAFAEYVAAHWRAYFPRLLSQSAFNRRVRDLGGVLAGLGPAVASRLRAHLGEPTRYEVWDGLPIPLMRLCRGWRHRCFGDEAGFGRGGVDRERYYGVHLLAAVDQDEAITGFVLGPADTSEYWLAEALLRWRADPHGPAPTAEELAPILGPTHARGGQRQGPTGPLGPRLAVGQPAPVPTVADLGFAGGLWRAHWQHHYGADVLTKAQYTALPPAERATWTGWLCGLRQRVETAFGALTTSLGAKFPRARTLHGLRTRLAAKVAAYNLALYVNHLFGRPTFSLFDPLA